MPVYEFICEKCDQTFEFTASFFEDLEAPECPHCQSKDTRKKYSFFMSSFGNQAGDAASSCGGGGGRFT